MLEQIPQKRLLIYLMILGLLPVFFVGFRIQTRNNQINSQINHIATVYDLAIVKEHKQKANRTVRAYFRDSDHFYIDKHLESLTFLEPEIEHLQEILSLEGVGESKIVKKRFDFLSDDSNRLVFTEGGVQIYNGMQETTETMAHPVEINLEDLQKLLARIEGVELLSPSPSSARPQMIIIDFRLDKKQAYGQHEVFSLFMRLLTREFL